MRIHASGVVICTDRRRTRGVRSPMANKRKQHFVPQVYLKAFCDSTPPEGWAADRPYKPAVWVMNKSLAEEPRRRAPSKILWSSQTYTLDSDDPDRPVIEDQLAELEGKYAGVLPKVMARAEVIDRDRINLCLFIGALFHRTLSQMAFQQEQIDKIRHLYRQIDRVANSNERYSNEYWAGADEAGKQMAIRGARAYARIIDAAGPWFLVNESEFPFITSDRPVTHQFLHIDDLATMGFPPVRQHPNARACDRTFLSFTPLTPTIASVSSPLLVSPQGSMYWTTESAALAGSLNLLTRARADQLLVSPVPRPFGANQARLLEYETQERMRPADSRPTLLIYTDRSHHVFRLESWTHRPGIFDSHLTFVTEDLDGLRALADSECIEFATLRYKSGEIGMRQLVWHSVAIVPGAPSELVQDGGREWPKRTDRLPLDEQATRVDSSTMD
jgi:hypothetical protein